MTAKRILIVDDEAHIRELLDDVISGSGLFDPPAVIFTAESGAAALDIANANRIDLVLLDFNMPGMTGSELARRLRADFISRSVPIVMITAMDDTVTRARAEAAGVDRFIPKPFRFSEVRDVIAEFFRK
jgi:CheY-like chemotaxis protein